MSSGAPTNGNSSGDPPASSPPTQRGDSAPPAQRGCFGWVLFFLKRLAESIEAVFRWLLAYPLLTLQLLLLYLIAWGGLGSEVGAEHLFWHENPLIQFGTGITVGMLAGVILFLNYLLYRPEWLVGPVKPDPNNPKPGILAKFPGTLLPSNVDEVRLLGKYLLWTQLLVLVFFIGPKLYVAATSKEPGFSDYMWERNYLLPFLVGYIAAGFFAYFLFLCDERLHWGSDTSYRECMLDFRIAPVVTEEGLFRKKVRDYLTGLHTDPVPKEELPLHGIAVYLLFVSFCVLGLLLVAVAILDETVPGFSLTGLVSLVALMLIVFSMVYGFFAFHLHVQRLVFAVIVIGLMVWNSTERYEENNYKLQFAGIDYSRKTPLWDPTKEGEERDVFNKQVLPKGKKFAEERLIDSTAPVRALSEEWGNSHPVRDSGEKQKPKLIFICTSGGGIRAAVWTAVVLRRLEEKIPGTEPGHSPFRKHVRMVTGASGGMVGATLFVADYPDDGETVSPEEFESRRNSYVEILADDSLTRTAQSLVVRDLMWNTVFVPPWKHATWDRGQTLEWKWGLSAKQRLGRNPFDKTFTALRGDKEKKTGEWGGKRPSLVFSPMMVEDSRRLLITNLNLQTLTSSDSQTEQICRSGVEFHRLFPDLTPEEAAQYRWEWGTSHGFKVSTAARMSATFPVISPAVSLPTTPARRVVDAGYYDNYGVGLMAAWLLDPENTSQLKLHTSGIALIEIRAYPLSEGGRLFASIDSQTGEPTLTDSRGGLFSDLLSAVSAPLDAVLSARGNIAYHRNSEWVDRLHATFNEDYQPGFFHSTRIELTRPAALNWYMTSTERKNIEKILHGNPPGEPDSRIRKDWERLDKELNALKTWFGKGGE
ncbi:MAG: DUF308 domain-containing protein [Planctomycetia bacterium]|nr:DUF308 domain-containing protein [Planctomycetia bacterium]